MTLLFLAFAQAGLALFLLLQSHASLHFFNRKAPELIGIFLAGALLRQFVPKCFRPYLMLISSWVGLLVVFPLDVSLAALMILGFVIAVAESGLRMFWKTLLIGAVLAFILYKRQGGPAHALQISVLLAPIFFLRIFGFVADSHEKPSKPGTKWAAWRVAGSYLMALPGFAIPLFPLVDFQKFKESESDDPETIRGGADLLVIGAIQITVYRIVSSHFLVRFDQVDSIRLLVLFLLLKYSTYLEISGTFHVCVGLLRLFGYNLQASHRLFLFPRSFIDYWRRSNTYWRDFMSKFIYFPVYFRMRRKNEALAWVGGTALVFLASGLLHVYLFFCVMGKWMYSWGDAIFWSIFGIGALTNTYLELRPGRRPVAPNWSFGSLATSAFKISGMTVFITVIYSIWLGPGLAGLISGLERIQWRDPFDYVWLFAFVFVGAIGAVLTTLECYQSKAIPHETPTFRLRDLVNFAAVAGGLSLVFMYLK